MKKTIIASSMLIGLVFLTGCSQQPAKQTQSIISTPVVQQPVSTPTPATQELNQQPTAQTADETINWKTYQNNELGFELKTPTYMSVDIVLNDQYNRVVIFKSNKENLEVRLKEGEKISLEQYQYLDFPVSSKSIIDKKEALVFEAPKGYCDGPGCSNPFITYSTKNENDFYNLIFSGDVKMNEIEKTILSSFKFIQKKPTPTSEQSSWKIYTNKKFGFQIEYPQNFIYNESDTIFYFGTPESKAGGYIWSVNIYQPNELEKIIKQIGKQFEDRKELRQNIAINKDTTGIMVTVTTNQYSDWIYKTVYITSNDQIFAIGNGAVDDNKFETFYKSFKLIK